MNSDYDENLRENIFFMEILQHHSDIIKKAAKENWIICIPRSGTIESNEININVILDQILIPQEDGILKISQLCSTLSKKHLQLRKNKIMIEDCHFFSDTINILFKETFYDGKDSSYSVWCIDKPLFLDHPCCTLETQVLESLPDCIDFLWVESTGQDVLQQIQNLCIKFIEVTPNYELEHIQTQKDLIGSLYSRCLQKALRNTNIRAKAMDNDQFLEKLKLAVETYMQYCLGKKIIFGISTFMADAESHLNKIIKNSHSIKDKHLGISSSCCEVLSGANCELSKLNNTLTILDKVNCLDRTFNALCGNSSSCITSDDLLQMFASIILKANIYNWVSNLHFIQDFKFCSSSFTDHVNFLLTTVEAAVEYLKSDHFFELLRSSPVKYVKEQKIFELVRTGKLISLRAFFENSETTELVGKMCHPLCICKDCDQIAKNILIDKEIRNEKDQTLLIYATLYEQTEIVEYLLNNCVDVNAQDYVGKSALHYASEKGYQDIIMLLISDENTNINIQDHNGDTPLHLSTGRAHENCVKALIYSSSSLKMDIFNNLGESVLSLAAKAGFLQIIQILLENLTYTLSEKEIYSILNNCHNFNIKNIVEQFSVKKVLFTFPFSHNGLKSMEPIQGNFGIKPKTENEQRKVHLLLNAIRNNDIPLACFYLGFNHANKSIVPSKCHPLCNCEKCQKCSSDDMEVSIDMNRKKSENEHEEIHINMCNIDGLTPLHVAAQYGRSSLLRILLDCGAQVNIQTYKDLYTPLHLGCFFQQISIVKELVKCTNCNVNIKDAQGNTALFYACIKNDSRIIEILLRNDADHEIQNNEGYTVWDICQKQMLYCAFKAIKKNVKYSSVEQTEHL